MENMNKICSRGAFIVFEGCDRVGKTTQCKDLVQLLNKSECKSMYMNFPDRSTPSGQLINSYLTNKLDLEDESIHLLFTLNRWEAKKKMEKLLNEGITLIVDRYSYSGVAFSAAKGVDFEWCKAPEKFLLKPDVVIYLALTSDALAKRGGFGDERYETTEFQNKVREAFRKLKDDNYWKEIDADRPKEDLLNELNDIAKKTIEKVKHSELGLLW